MFYSGFKHLVLKLSLYMQNMQQNFSIMNLSELQQNIFSIKSEEEFNLLALEVFRFQYRSNFIYRHYCDALGTIHHQIKTYREIPFLPIGFFKNHIITCGSSHAPLIFSSSGTTGSQTSKHYVLDPELYIKSFSEGFRRFFGDPQEYYILALLPGYLEREGSSLIYMVNELIRQSHSSYSGFYLNEYALLHEKITSLHDDKRKILLLGVSFALLDMAEQLPVHHPNLLIMETGGMKGRRREMVREELHAILKEAFGVPAILSEYGMTELLSQAYSLGEGAFESPPWMKVIIRETNDPFSFCPVGFSGGVNVIDLANLYSCSFIATQDLGRITHESQFEITGRFDNSDIRGCNLMV
jgi:phenylacetate-coenzyme A ligase PaaK-like adenylate-forming protein